MFVVVTVGGAILSSWLLVQYRTRVTFAKRLAARVQLSANEKGELVNIAALTSFGWERLFVFPPYTSPEQIRSGLGHSWVFASLTGIQNSEGHCLLVFTKSDRVVQHCMFQRKHGDFTSADARLSMVKDNAVFLSKRMKVGFHGSECERLVVLPLTRDSM